MTQLHTPYHFVPLSHWVYMPNWAHLVSHDHPFQDGLSGKLVFKINNTTPLCIGHDKDEAGILKLVRDSQNKPIIPQTTLKGMVRNVLEIASFGKLNLVNDKQFTYRDISNSKTDYLINVIGKNNVAAGWVKYNSEDERWEFYHCDYAKIHHDEIKKATSCTIQNKQSAVSKYTTLPLTSTISATISAPRGKQKNSWAEKHEDAGVKGNVVFTNARILNGKNKPDSYEFSYFFYNTAKKPTYLDIDKHVQNLFSNHNEDHVKHLKNNSSPEYGIPVFALIEQGGTLHSLGFAKMPRVRYKNSIHDMIRHTNPAHLSDAYFDLAELILGTIKDQDLGLRSRVSFSDAVIQSDYYKHSIYQAPTTVLAEPKATFLGAYIEQNQSAKYNSYNHDTAALSGWKRYPSQQGYKGHLPTTQNDKINSRFELLEEGHEFQGHLTFHNLKKIELAALVWCLTLGNSSYQRHSIGHAKPLGAGAISLNINEEQCLVKANDPALQAPINVVELVALFEQHMNENFPHTGHWFESPQINYLLALTDEDIENYNDFRYMQLEQFSQVKKAVKSLPDIDHNGKVLSRSDSISEPSASLSFGKGRLSKLLTNSAFDNAQLGLTQQLNEKQLKAAKKVQLAEEKSALDNSGMTESEKCAKRIELLTVNQEAMTRTEQNNRTSELREYVKVIKKLELTASDAQILQSRLNELEFGEKIVKKAIKHLEKII